MDRVGLVFVLCAAIAVVVSLMQPKQTAAMRIELKDVDHRTQPSFNIAAVAVTLILVALYATWW